jgi:hypothetical protein
MEEQTTGTNSAPGAAALTESDQPLAPALDAGAVNDAASPEPSKRSSTWIEWVRQGLRAATFRSVQAVPEGPHAWPMLLIIATLSAIGIGASRLEFEGPASFDVRSWLFSWAPEALVVFGVWLILNGAREKAKHASPAAAWYLLFSIAMLPITALGTFVLLALHEQFPLWWEQGNWIAWAIYAFLWVCVAIAT